MVGIQSLSRNSCQKAQLKLVGVVGISKAIFISKPLCHIHSPNLTQASLDSSISIERTGLNAPENQLNRNM